MKRGSKCSNASSVFASFFEATGSRHRSAARIAHLEVDHKRAWPLWFPWPWRSSSSNNLALTRKMPLAFANMAFNLRQVGGNEVAVHTHNNPSAEAGVPR